MEFRNLSQSSIAKIAEVFNAAFAGYYVPINFSEEGMRFRVRRGRIDLALSEGAFEKGKLVAFMLSGTDDWEQLPTIYNAGTGVLPDWRGQQLVDKMYAWAGPYWQAAGYVQATLEVIVKNARAIRAYERVGMQVERTLYSLQAPEKLDSEAAKRAELQEVNQANWAAYAPLRSFAPSWDFCAAGVDAVADTCRCLEWRAAETGALRGFAIVNDKEQIAQAGVTNPKDWVLLLRGLGRMYPALKWINVGEAATELRSTLDELGWTSLLNQYEMKMKI